MTSKAGLNSFLFGIKKTSGLVAFFVIILSIFYSSTKPVIQNKDETMNVKDKSEKEQVEQLVEKSIPMESINKLSNLSASKSAEILTKENRDKENFEKTNSVNIGSLSNQSVSKSIKSLNRSVSKSAKAVNRDQDFTELALLDEDDRGSYIAPAPIESENRSLNKSGLKSSALTTMIPINKSTNLSVSKSAEISTKNNHDGETIEKPNSGNDVSMSNLSISKSVKSISTHDHEHKVTETMIQDDNEEEQVEGMVDQSNRSALESGAKSISRVQEEDIVETEFPVHPEGSPKGSSRKRSASRLKNRLVLYFIDIS